MNINFYIERLILDGVPVASHQSDSVQTAVEAELGRLLASEPFAPASSFAEASVATQEMQIHPGISARDLGAEIGRRVIRGLTQPDLNCGAVRESASAGRLVSTNLHDVYDGCSSRKTTSESAQIRSSRSTQASNQSR